MELPNAVIATLVIVSPPLALVSHAEHVPPLNLQPNTVLEIQQRILIPVLLVTPSPDVTVPPARPLVLFVQLVNKVTTNPQIHVLPVPFLSTVCTATVPLLQPPSANSASLVFTLVLLVHVLLVLVVLAQTKFFILHAVERPEAILTSVQFVQQQI